MRKKKIHLSQKQRIEVQQKLKKGITIAEISDFYGIGETTVYKIKKQKISMGPGINPERKRNHPLKYNELDEQLFKWYQDQETSGDIPTYELLKKQAKKFINDVEGPSKEYFYEWLDKFINRRNIQLEAEFHISHKEVDIALINWLLKQIISKNAISDKMLIDETLKFMKEFGVSLTPNGKVYWLKSFKICHKILINSILQNRVERNDETNQSVKNLDEQLLNWLLEQKKSGDTISYAMLTEKIFILIDQFDKLSKEMQRESWLFRIQNRYRMRHMFQKTAVVQNVIRRDTANQSNVEKFIQLFSSQLEEENIDAENIYNMIETDVIWKCLIHRFSLLDETNIAKKQIDIENLKKNPLTVIFCTNVTGNNILPPILVKDENEYENQTMSEHCESRLLVPHKLQENASMEESKDFAYWYKYLFKTYVKYHQKKKNITGKVLLLVDNRIQRIFPEDITQDKDIEILFLPTNAVSFFESLYPKLIVEIDKIFQDDIINLCEKKSFCEAREFNRNYNIIYCINTICGPWSRNAPEDIEKLWRRFLRQNRQIQEDTPTLPSTSSQD